MIEGRNKRLMNSLNSVYETTRAQEKRPFDVDAITDVLMAEPLNLDISDIFHTPQTVVVNKSKDEYLNRRIVAIIKDKFDVESVCKADKVIFS